MDKFEKKIRKIIKNPENALVVGTGFGNLASIINTHRNVFIVDHNDCAIKSKNLIYREDLEQMHFINDVRVIYLDLDKVHHLTNLEFFWTNNRSLIIIEGKDPIGRKDSKPLYNSGWECTSVEKHFHVWEKTR